MRLERLKQMFPEVSGKLEVSAIHDGIRKSMEAENVLDNLLEWSRIQSFSAYR
jgi:hypothetical protein